jgi:hypothetical protein
VHRIDRSLPRGQGSPLFAKVTDQSLAYDGTLIKGRPIGTALLFVSPQIYPEALSIMLNLARFNFSLAFEPCFDPDYDFPCMPERMALIKHAYLAIPKDHSVMPMYQLLKSLTALELFEFSMADDIQDQCMAALRNATRSGVPNERFEPAIRSCTYAFDGMSYIALQPPGSV